ncbi:MAG: efflux RND transporter periplasmic adaptor subunit [Woeseiaceae bacterium]|nr:efflux RND transporter periplasmic adaptor subunit [Woeseiaceae bacterium]
MKSSKINLLLAVLALPPLLHGCGVGEASVVDAAGTRAETPLPVEVAYPTREDIFATYAATATIGSEGDAPVLARVAGDVVELLVEEGDWVDEGQLLARLDGERLRLEMLAAKADLDRARGEYERYRDLHARGLVSDTMYDGLRYDLDALEATYRLKKLNFSYSGIRATIPGYVSARNIKLGQAVRENDELFRITDTSQLVAYLHIPQTELEKFAAGHAATLEVDSMPDREYGATIARISPTIDTRNGTFRATAHIDNSLGELAPGMFARFTIAYQKHPNSIVIPAKALVEEDELTTVYVVSDGQVSRRSIETGVQSGGRVQVIDGLTEDDQIVVVGQSALRDGSKVLARSRDQDRYTG